MQRELSLILKVTRNNFIIKFTLKQNEKAN